MNFESVKKQIEATPQIAELEAHWWKNPREKLQEAMVARAPNWAVPDYTKSGEMSIHTHPGYLKPSLPSFQDLVTFRNMTSRLMVVAAMTPKGKVAGYTFINKDPKKELPKETDLAQLQEIGKLRYAEIIIEIEKIREEISKLKKTPPTTETRKKISELFTKWSNFGKELTNIIQEQIKRNDWRIRFVPLEGFEFKNGYYIPKPATPPNSGNIEIKITNPSLKETQTEIKTINLPQTETQAETQAERKTKTQIEDERLKKERKRREIERLRNLYNLQKQKNRRE